MALRNTDIVILCASIHPAPFLFSPALTLYTSVTGLAGAGKSQFINTLLGEENRMPVGHKLTSCTTQLDHAVIDPIPTIDPTSGSHCLPGRRLVIVDTPGFNDAYENDTEILRRFAAWLEPAFRNDITLGGVIYLHDISRDRFSTMAAGDINLLRRSIIRSNEALQRVVLATTKWDRIAPSEGQQRQDELQGAQWKTLIGRGSKVHRYSDTRDGAWEIVSTLLKCVEIGSGRDIEAGISEELQKIRPILENKARKELVYSRVLRPIFGLFGLGR
ncbi:P-loop containing nucleoside triphosphate hydrolase protein [Lyophyllum atratum]|nr:P-loop containing nucleoside triphosphate hydrolase protein [Lyophyllum atratum]